MTMSAESLSTSTFEIEVEKKKKGEKVGRYIDEGQSEFQFSVVIFGKSSSKLNLLLS